MSNYVQTVFFTPKDSLPPSNPAKTIFGAAYDVEFGNIATAISSKYDVASIAAGPIAFALGSAALPSITFVGETGTGLYSNGSGDIGHATAGVARLTISGTTGGVSINAPTSGTALSVSSAGLATIASFDSTRAGGGFITLTNSGAVGAFIGTGTDVSAGVTLGDLVLASANTRSIQLTRGGGNGLALTVAGTGAVTIALPSAGTGLTIVGGGFAVSAGTSAVQALTATTGAFSALLNANLGLTVTGGASSLQAMTATTGTFSALLSANLGLTVAGAAFTSRGITDNATATALAISAGGNVTINAPSSGTALTVTGPGNARVFQFNAAGNGILGSIDTTSVNGAYLAFTLSGTPNGYIGCGSSVITSAALVDFCITPNTGILRLGYNNGAATALSINSTGAVSIANPSSGNPLTITTASAGNALVCSDGTNSSTVIAFSGAHRVQIGSTAAFDFDLLAQGAVVATLSSGLRIGAPTGGDQGTGTLNATGLFINGAPIAAGIPQNSQSAAYTLVLADANKHIYHPSADTTARTWTIPANASVAFPIGTAVTFDNDTSGGAITLAITTDTLVWLPSGSTGSRTIAANGQGTALKVTATRWHLTGVGIT